MSVRVEGSLLPELRRFGATEISACFNCGNCSAVCPLTPEDGAFPRRIIRYAQLGMRDQLLASPELWTCYQCGDCTDTCPRDADPAGFMAAARRYAIAAYDRTGLARRLATSRTFAIGSISLLVTVLAAFLYSGHHAVRGTELALFRFVSAGFIHDFGLIVLGLLAVAAVAGLAQMVRRVFRAEAPPGGKVSRWSRGRIREALWYALGRESLGQERYRKECGSASDDQAAQPWYLRRWFVHASMVWGFLGLLGATILDYGLELTGIKPTGTAVPIWYPVRLLGTVAGLLLVYGSTVAIVRRVRGTEPSYARSSVSDWWFLWLLWLAGVSGFALELALYLPKAPGWGYLVFLLHVAVAMVLVLLAPFGKFAHAIYRPVALFAFRLRSGD